MKMERRQWGGEQFIRSSARSVVAARSTRSLARIAVPLSARMSLSESPAAGSQQLIALPISSASPAVDILSSFISLDTHNQAQLLVQSIHSTQSSSHKAFALQLNRFSQPQTNLTFAKNASQSTEDSYHWRQGPSWQGTCREEGGWQEDCRSLWREEEAHQVEEGDLL